uniref:Uncharacterized protein n=1 Tax=Ditylum brightwellii TaxID=49249 RepID=A0A6V2CAH7_9STRA
MAIRFYERYGFVRVGAITRFKDNAMMPEVAYRHWSEIVDGEALEPSYMMALRFKETSTHGLCSMNSQITNREAQCSSSERLHEIKSALKSVFTLLAEALTIRATGSQIYSNSFREMMLTALIFAKSAEDDSMVSTMNEALDLASSNSSAWSKNLIREELSIPRPKEIRQQQLSSGALVELRTPQASCSQATEASGCPLSDPGSTALLREANDMSEGASYTSQLKSIKVTVKMKHEEGPSNPEHSQQLVAEVLPSFLSKNQDKIEKRADGWVCRDVAVSVVVDGSTISNDSTFLTSDQQCLGPRSGETLNSFHRLEAELFMPPFDGNVNDIRDADRSAFENLKESFQDEVSWKKPVRGDSIMLKVDGYDGSPLWLTVEVEKTCAKRERPPGGDSHNSYMVKYYECGSWQYRACILDRTNQGIGRGWCNHSDWCSFALLPVSILDTILIGSWVEYPAVDNTKVQGRISRRVGGGLVSVPKWRVVLSPTSPSTNDTEELAERKFKDLTAGELREAISVDDDAMKRTVKLSNEIDLLPSHANVPSANVPSANVPSANVPSANVPSANVPSANVPSLGVFTPVSGKSTRNRSLPTRVIKESVTPKDRSSQKDPAFADLTESEIEMAADEWATRRIEEYDLG